MKRVQFILFTVLSAFILTFSSCSKTEDAVTPDNPLTSGGSITLKVNGTSWNASLAVVGINQSGVINVTGSDSNGKQASIILYNVTETGTYQLGGLGNVNQLRWTEGLGQNDSYICTQGAGSGTVTLTELSSSKVKGTFSFTGINTAQVTKSITDGVFEATF